jgi:hypothetical protein
MPRRRKSAAEDVVDIVSILPWWVGCTLAVVSYVVLHLELGTLKIECPQLLKSLEVRGRGPGSGLTLGNFRLIYSAWHENQEFIIPPLFNTSCCGATPVLGTGPEFRH